MDLRGVEPLSENPSITASPITVCYNCKPKVCMFPPSIANRHALDFSSFIIRLHPQSFGCIVSYIVDARVLTCRCVRSDSCHIRQRVLNCLQRLFFLRVLRWSPATNGFRNFKIPVETSTSPGLSDDLISNAIRRNFTNIFYSWQTFRLLVTL